LGSDRERPLGLRWTRYQDCSSGKVRLSTAVAPRRATPRRPLASGRPVRLRDDPGKSRDVDLPHLRCLLLWRLLIRKASSMRATALAAAWEPELGILSPRRSTFILVCTSLTTSSAGRAAADGRRRQAAGPARSTAFGGSPFLSGSTGVVRDLGTGAAARRARLRPVARASPSSSSPLPRPRPDRRRLILAILPVSCAAGVHNDTPDRAPRAVLVLRRLRLGVRVLVVYLLPP